MNPQFGGGGGGGLEHLHQIERDWIFNLFCRLFVKTVRSLIWTDITEFKAFIHHTLTLTGEQIETSLDSKK